MTSWLEQFRTPPDPPSVAAFLEGTDQPTGFEAGVLAAEVNNVKRATQGERNHALNKAAFNLGQIMPADAFYTDLLNAALSIGLTRGEATATIQSAIRGAQRNPRPEHRMARSRNGTLKDVQDTTPLEAWNPPAQGINGQAPGSGNPPSPEPGSTIALIDWNELWADTTTLEWILEPLIPQARGVALYSPPKVGKSLLMLELAVAISNGTDALGVPTHQTKVLYLDYENDPRADVKQRLIAMGHTPQALQNLAYASYPDLPPLNTPEGAEALLRAVHATGAGLVIVDTISRAITGEENDNNTWLDLYRYTGLALKREGVAMLRLDHSGKDVARGQRGGSAKSGDVDLVWRMTEAIPEETYLVECEANRLDISERRLTLRRATLPLRHDVETAALGKLKEGAILEALDRAGLERSAGRERARAVLTETGIKVRDSVLSDILKRRKGYED